MKKWFCLALALCLALCTLVTAGVAEEEKVVIEMAVSGSLSEIALREETANLYMELHPNVEIKWVDLGDDRVVKTMALISSGEAPDILYLNENIYTYTTRGVLEPLTQYIEAEGEGYLDYFYDSLLEPLTYEGELYALPQEVSPYVIYYNKDLFDKYGVEYPTNDWTFDDWCTACPTWTGWTWWRSSSAAWAWRSTRRTCRESGRRSRRTTTRRWRRSSGFTMRLRWTASRRTRRK